VTVVAANGSTAVVAAARREQAEDDEPPHASIVSRPCTPECRFHATAITELARMSVTRFDRFYEPLLVGLLAAVVFYGTL